MTRAEACEALGVRPDAGLEEILAAYRAAAKLHHPDLNPGDEQAAARFRRVQEAKETLLGRTSACRGEKVHANGGDGRHEEAGTHSAHEGVPDLLAMARAFMVQHDLEVLFDRTIRVRSAPRMAFAYADLDRWFAATPEVEPEWVIDELILHLNRLGIEPWESDVRRVVRKII